ncbi:MAG: 1-acyl-sn-glycerol-3-phosphate acyltransferase [Betaproteobacteria bacterium]|nr:MAG: 1-acyl-sn-glycerol-3-phosphate acyltransferase [Betaproteobacteria bacterium]
MKLDTSPPRSGAEAHPLPRPIRWFRLSRLMLHLVHGILVVAVWYPLIGTERRLRLKQAWSEKLLNILGVHLQAQLQGLPPGSLLVANHVSWLDVYLINAAQPAAFVSKAEVRQWPVIGWLSARTDTIFLRRGSRGHARIINEEIGAILGRGHMVVLFPEGTTTDGGSLLHFHGALLQPAIEAGRPIVPLALSYHDRNGRRSTAAAYVGETSLWQCLQSILAAGWLAGRVEACPPLTVEAAGGRKELAQQARQQIATRLMLGSNETGAAEPLQDAA